MTEKHHHIQYIETTEQNEKTIKNNLDQHVNEMSNVNNAVQIRHILYSVAHLRDIYIGYMFSSAGYNLTDKVPPLVLGGNT